MKVTAAPLPQHIPVIADVLAHLHHPPPVMEVVAVGIRRMKEAMRAMEGGIRRMEEVKRAEIIMEERAVDMGMMDITDMGMMAIPDRRRLILRSAKFLTASTKE